MARLHSPCPGEDIVSLPLCDVSLVLQYITLCYQHRLVPTHYPRFVLFPQLFTGCQGTVSDEHWGLSGHSPNFLRPGSPLVAAVPVTMESKTEMGV